jgi:mRNA-degrading endonuclease RelE of RelBE toxin-antitoxin system
VVLEECVEWEIVWSRRVRKWLRRHPEAVEYYGRGRELIVANPYSGERLHGRCRGLWKLRVGELRIVYRILGDDCIVAIEAVGYRENIYEELGC